LVQQIFVNLPVRDLKRSVDFFTRLGFRFDPRFTDENATCMILGENIFAMLLVEPFFQTWTPKPVADATRTTEVLLSVAVESRARVRELVEQAVAAGAATPRPAQDHGFMFQHGFHDLDGHVWEVFHMDPAQQTAQ
jgi:predicted lactoylglutathione lyase